MCFIFWKIFQRHTVIDAIDLFSYEAHPKVFYSFDCYICLQLKRHIRLQDFSYDLSTNPWGLQALVKQQMTFLM